MNRKKILVVDAFKSTGGEEEVAYLVYKNLNRKKFCVYLSSPSSSPYFKKFKPLENEWFKCDFKNKFDFRAFKKFRTYILNNNIDIVNVHGYIAGFYVRMALLGTTVKVIWTMHVDIQDVPNMSYLRKKIRKLIENSLNRFATDEVICVSKNLQNRLTKYVKAKKSRVIYNGVNIYKFKKKNYNSIIHVDGKILKIGFVSRLSMQKGIPYLMDAIKQLRDLGVHFIVFIAGEGDQEDFIKSYLLKHNLNKFVKMIGFQKDVSKVLDQIDLLVLPSLFEGFPMVILESLATGTPVIATKVNGVPEIIKNNVNGSLIKARSSSELVHAILLYYNNRDLLVKQGENGNNIVAKQFTQERMLKMYESIFNE